MLFGFANCKRNKKLFRRKKLLIKNLRKRGSMLNRKLYIRGGKPVLYLFLHFKISDRKIYKKVGSKKTKLNEFRK